MKTKKPIILFVARQIGTTGGAERRLLQLLSSPLKDKFELISYSFLGTLDVYIKRKKNRVLRNLQYIGRLFKLWYFLRKEKPDLIHSFDLESGVYIKIIQKYLFTSRSAKLIIGFGANTIEHAPTANILSRNSFQPDAYTCNSAAGKKCLNDILPKFAPPIYVIYNGLSTLPALKDEPEWRKKNSLIVGCISKFDNNKRGERIFELAEALGSSHPNIHFVFIGTGGGFNEWKSYYESQKKRFYNLTLLGVVQDAIQLVHYFDIGILFSENEGFPNAVLEYMLCGKPVVTTIAGETTTLVKNNENGFLVDPYEVEKFSAKIQQLCTDEEARRRMGEFAREYAKNSFSFTKMVEKHRFVYESLLYK